MKSDLSYKIKQDFFQAVAMSVPPYRCTTWSQTKHIEKKLKGNSNRMLQVILNNSWKQHPTKQQLYDHLSPTLKTVKLDEQNMWDTVGEVKTNS